MEPWVGVDLDGTLARYDGWQGPEHIGEPIPRMVERVQRWIQQGVKVKIFTARASVMGQIPYVREWVDEHVGPGIEITNIKDYGMTGLWDDRCVPVVSNTGEVAHVKVLD